MTSSHIYLLVDDQGGVPHTEPVHAALVAPNRYRLLWSPGFVQGVAAGDEIELLGPSGSFRVVRRSGNVCVQLFSAEPVAPHLSTLTEAVTRLGGTVDGHIERGVVCTVPHSVGFPTLDHFFNTWVASHPGWEWFYGNVYDPADGITPLRWWRSGGTA